MNQLYTTFITPGKFAFALAEVLENRGLKAVRRPLNSTKADTTAWWVVPSSGRPFFRHGRFFFDWSDRNSRTALLVGFNISKGLSPSLAPAYSSRKGQNLIMDASWTWNAFAAALKSGALTERLPDSFSIAVSGGYVQDPWEDPYSRNYGFDRYLLSFQNKKCTVKALCRDSMLLKTMNRVSDMKSFSSEIEAFDKEDWLWLDMFIFCNADIKTAVSGEGQLLNAEAFCSSFMSALMEFYK